MKNRLLADRVNVAALAEFDFRYSNRAGLGVTDVERAAKALAAICGKRLTYRRINGPRSRKQLARKFLRWRKHRNRE
jgi:hypothetical protein